MRAVVIGAVGSTEVILDRLADTEGWTVPMVVTLPDDLRKRHSDFVDLQPHAERLGAELFCARNTNDPETLAAIDRANPDYVFVIGWSQICGPAFLALRPGKVIGYHPAPLPRLRGRAALPWTILLDERISAGSLFWVDEGTDSGDILAQHYFHLAGDEKAADLYARHMQALGAMLAEVLPMLARGEERRIAQDDRFATWATRRTPADGKIDWRDSAQTIDRLVRAVGRPYPGAFTHSGENRLIVWESAIEAGSNRHHAIPGQIVLLEGDEIVVQTGSGLLRLTDWEIEGGKAPRVHAMLEDFR